MSRIWLKVLGAAVGTALFVAAGQAQGYPSKPIKILVPTQAGGIADQIARIISQHLTDSAKQTVVVENRTGGGGAIAADAVAKSPADGYTILLGLHATNAILPLLNPKLGYDPTKDFVEVIHVGTFPNLLVVNGKMPVNSVAELVDYAKKNPGKISYASQGNGSSGHMMGEQFKLATGTDLVHVPYRGAAPAVQDLVAGQVQMMFDTVTLQAPQLEAGNTRALAITAAQRLALLPNVPTMAEAGFPGVETGTWYGILAPARTPPAIIAHVQSVIVRILQAPDLKTRILNQGVDIVASSPAEFEKFIIAEVAKWSRVVKAAGVRAD